MTLETYHFPARLGGTVFFDFTNTIEFRDSERCVEALHSYQHLLAWCRQTGLVSDWDGARCETLATAHPAQADAAFRAALDLRDALYRIFTTIIDGEPPPADDLARLNGAFARVTRRVEANGEEFRWVWAFGDDLRDILAPVAWEAADFLTSDQLQWVRQCPNCGWLFVDTSRNHSRRWCSMDVCGSQVKSRRQYERRRTAKA
ncbi:MAG: ABATE domain-containing protein [Anaerolineae bacterium]|nr:ABATE domain-containing protein [Anaerolineae bacterium]